MLYKELTIGEKVYKLRLDAKNSVSLEKAIGKNPLNIFMEMGETEKMPYISDLIYIFAYSLQKYQHGITINDAYDIYDEWIEEGHSMEEFIPIITDILEVSGYMREPKTEETENNSEVGATEGDIVKN